MRRDRTRAVVAVWGATGAAVAASAAGMVLFRQDVAELWPRSASAFAALGLDVNVYGLEFYDLSVQRSFDGDKPILVVSGEVRNIGRDSKMIPPVRLSLRDQQSHEIYQLVNAVSDQPLAAGAAKQFQIRVENPPTEAVDLEATFASYGEATMAGGPAHVSPSNEQQQPLLLTQPAAPAPGANTPTADAQPVDGLAPRFTNG